MSLRQSSLKDFFQAIARNDGGGGVYQDNSSKQLEEPTDAGPLLGISPTGNLANSTAKRGAFPNCPRGPSTAAATTTSIDSVTSVTGNQKRKEEMDESAEEPEGKRAKIPPSAVMNMIVDADDEAVYEPQPKRRKLSHRTNLNAGNAFNSEDESFADDEADATGSEDNDSTVVAPCATNLNTEIAFDTDSGDESFAPDEADKTASEEDDKWTIEDDDESTLSFASSATMEPITPPATNSLQHASGQPSLAGRYSSADIDMHELKYSLPWLPPNAKVKGSRRRQAASFTVYEDETATAPMRSDEDFTEDSRMPAVRHRVLAPLDRGQENRQPVLPTVEAPIEVPAQFLHEEDGSEEEMERMAALEMDDSWPVNDEMYE